MAVMPGPMARRRWWLLAVLPWLAAVTAGAAVGLRPSWVVMFEPQILTEIVAGTLLPARGWGGARGGQTANRGGGGECPGSAGADHGPALSYSWGPVDGSPPLAGEGLAAVPPPGPSDRGPGGQKRDYLRGLGGERLRRAQPGFPLPLLS